MRKSVAFGIVIVLGLGPSIVPARAADISIAHAAAPDGLNNGSIDLDIYMPSNLRDHGSIACNIKLEGEIGAGDEAKLAAAIEQMKARSGEPGRLCLNSPGGSYEEGIKLAELLMKESIGTGVESGAKCASACALVFMAGTAAWKGQLNRFMHVGGRVQFHAPSIDARALEGRTFSGADISTSFQAAVSALNRLVKIGGDSIIRRFPNELMQEMLQRGPKDALFEIDTIGKAVRYRIGLYGGRPQSSLSLEQICNACQNYHYDGTPDDQICSRAVSAATTRRLATGERIVFDLLAPRGGSCVVDVEGSMAKPTHWYMTRLGAEGAAFGGDSRADTLTLAYWYLQPPSARLASLGSGFVGATCLRTIVCHLEEPVGRGFRAGCG